MADISIVTNMDRVPRQDGFLNLHIHRISPNVSFCKLKVNLYALAKMAEPFQCMHGYNPKQK